MANIAGFRRGRMCESALRHTKSSFNFHVLVASSAATASLMAVPARRAFVPRPSEMCVAAADVESAGGDVQPKVPSAIALVEIPVQTIKRMIGHFHAPSGFDVGLMLMLALLAATGLYLGH